MSYTRTISLTKNESVEIPFNYERAEFAFEKARFLDRGKPIDNNTRIMEREGTEHPITGDLVVAYAVKLHRTDIITIYPDDVQKLFCNGWETRTTRDRWNAYGAANVMVKNGIQYVKIPSEYLDERHTREGSSYIDYYNNPETRVVYSENMLVNSDGRPFKMDSEEHISDLERHKKKVDRASRNYREELAGYFAGHLDELQPGRIRDNEHCGGCIKLLEETERNESGRHLWGHVRDGDRKPAIMLKACANHAYGMTYQDIENVSVEDYENAYMDLQERRTVLGGSINMILERSIKNFLRERKSDMAKARYKLQKKSEEAA